MQYRSGWQVFIGLLVAAACGDSGTSSGSLSVGESVGDTTTSMQMTTGIDVPTTSPASTTELLPTTGDDPDPSTTEISTTTTTTMMTTGESSTTEPSSESDSSTGEELCEAPGILLVCDNTSNDPFHALGLGCPGAPGNTIPITAKQFESVAIAYRVARGFGTAKDPNDADELLFRPREGEKFLIISTGRVAALQPDGTVVEEPGSQFDNDNNFNPDEPNALPPPLSPWFGSNDGQGGTPSVNCDHTNDCSDSIQANWLLGNEDPDDLLFARLDVEVPGGTYGFSFDVAYFSSEYPQFVDQKFNDMFIGWTSSEAYTGNVTFFNNQPFTVTALAEEMEVAGFVGDNAALAGTGFEGYGSTGWVTINAQAQPREAHRLHADQQHRQGAEHRQRSRAGRAFLVDARLRGDAAGGLSH